MRALAVYREVNDRYCEAISLCNLAEVYVTIEAYDLAAACFADAIAAHDEVGNRHGAARTLIMLGGLQAEHGDRPAARGSWSRALAIFEELDDPEAAHARALLNGPGVPAAGRYVSADVSADVTADVAGARRSRDRCVIAA